MSLLAVFHRGTLSTHLGEGPQSQSTLYSNVYGAGSGLAKSLQWTLLFATQIKTIQLVSAYPNLCQERKNKTKNVNFVC
jgi:hypothetical protein